MSAETKRKSNFEWLRVLAMAMIITLHYMFKGNIVTDISENSTASNLILWLITYFCLGAVNVYVLISGYFLVETEFRLRRLADLILQILEYSLLITVGMLIVGDVSLSELTIYDWLGYIFPIGTEEYWFITAYALMYILTPVLGAGAKALSEKKLRIAIWLMLAFTVAEKTILPMVLPTDGMGYDLVWFIVLYLIAAYIRLHGIKQLEGHTGMAWLVYLVSTCLCWLVNVAGSILYTRTGIETVKHYADITTDYNFIFTLTAAIGLFYVFKNASFNEDSLAAELARQLGVLTLGVYLLHEHPLVRYRWQSWLRVSADRSLGGIILNWLLCVIVILVVGFLVEFVRGFLHGLIPFEKLFKKKAE